MDVLTTEIQGRPLSPIFEDISHYESRSGSSKEDEDAEIPEVAEEKGQCADTAASPPEQSIERTAMTPEEYARWKAAAPLSADNTTAVAAGLRGQDVGGDGGIGKNFAILEIGVE
ncbi:hypothetical protein PG991_012483 [Apiospora marii]|uniref:Uncharacterized protein n=1 Tax=Apiospora marii TaxID=335849 RepID=A0ABR1R9X7_9PEZI